MINDDIFGAGHWPAPFLIHVQSFNGLIAKYRRNLGITHAVWQDI